MRWTYVLVTALLVTVGVLVLLLGIAVLDGQDTLPWFDSPLRR